jgi:hypothetical protein
MPPGLILLPPVRQTSTITSHTRFKIIPFCRPGGKVQNNVTNKTQNHSILPPAAKVPSQTRFKSILFAAWAAKVQNIVTNKIQINPFCRPGGKSPEPVRRPFRPPPPLLKGKGLATSRTHLPSSWIVHVSAILLVLHLFIRRLP